MKIKKKVKKRNNGIQCVAYRQTYTIIKINTQHHTKIIKCIVLKSCNMLEQHSIHIGFSKLNNKKKRKIFEEKNEEKKKFITNNNNIMTTISFNTAHIKPHKIRFPNSMKMEKYTESVVARHLFSHALVHCSCIQSIELKFMYWFFFRFDQY